MLEPSMSYSYSSVSRVSIERFTILPALLVGLIDVVEADRDTFSSSLTARYGVANRFEMELRGSYRRLETLSTSKRNALTPRVRRRQLTALGAAS
jgi:hypothetical protein